jgi:hypothetical protein
VPSNSLSKDRTTIIYVLGAFIREQSRVSKKDEQPPEDVIAGSGSLADCCHALK